MDNPRLRARLNDERYPTEQLRAVQEMRRLLDALERRLLYDLHHAGLSWDDLAMLRGTSRQSIRRFLARTRAGENE
jgi:hypothetical protein